MDDERILREAEFDPRVCTYWLLTYSLIFVASFFGVLFLPFWFYFGRSFLKRYLERMECTLTDRSLKVKKGIFVRVEKTIPLDKITDVALMQGPLMRHFEIESLSVETAGQSAAGAFVGITGIVGGRAFRDAVLEQRDIVATMQPIGPAAAPAGTEETLVMTGTDINLLQDIRDTLHRIEKRLETR